MPELPEVETVRRSLEQNARGRTFARVFVYREKLIKNFDARQLEGKAIDGVRRRGKYLLFDLSDGNVLLSHLRMEGRYFFTDDKHVRSKHDHVVFDLGQNRFMVYNDTRVFGTFHLYPKTEIDGSRELAKIAIDPLDTAFDGKYLKVRFAKKKIAVKMALLDQTLVSGIGNIYVDEILFASRINPLTPACAVSAAKCRVIATEARRILKLAVANHGSTIRTYHFNGGSKGNFQNLLQVHTKAGQPCPVCHTTIVKIKVNGRGTYFCPKCQA